jgi:hypothetical protein
VKGQHATGVVGANRPVDLEAELGRDREDIAVMSQPVERVNPRPKSGIDTADHCELVAGEIFPGLHLPSLAHDRWKLFLVFVCADKL